MIRLTSSDDGSDVVIMQTSQITAMSRLSELQPDSFREYAIPARTRVDMIGRDGACFLVKETPDQILDLIDAESMVAQ